MMSEWNPIDTFRLVEQAVESRLTARQYVKTKHDYHPQAHGTMYSVFSCPSGHARLTWDGKAEMLILRVYRKGNALARTIRMTFLGKYDLDKLEREIIVKADELRTADAEQLIHKFTESV